MNPKRLHPYQEKQAQGERRSILNSAGVGEGCHRDFFWFYEEWEIINRRFLKKFGKRLQHLLMELQHMHRVKKENHVVIDNVKKLEDLNYDDAWELSLRDNWERIPDDWRGFRFPPVKVVPPPKEVVRIGYADRLIPTLKWFDHANSYLKKPKREWGRWETYCFSMMERLRNEEPHYPEFPYLKVFGKRVRRRIPKVEKFVCPEEHKMCQRSPIPANKLSPSLFFEGPVADLSPPKLHFVCKPGEVVSQIVKLENLGSTVLFYNWERRPLEAMGITTPKLTLGVHVTNCRAFTVMNGSGSLLTGEAREFVFRFKSDVQGVFMESWVLRVAPRLRHRLEPLYLNGIATLKDEDRTLHEKLTKALNHRELMRGIGETLEIIQARASKLSRPTEEFRNAEYMFSSEAFILIKKNLFFDPPIYFIPSVYSKFEILARVVKEVLEQQPPLEDIDASEGVSDSVAGEGQEDNTISEGAEIESIRKGAAVKSTTPLPAKAVVDYREVPDSSEGDAISDQDLAELLGPGSVITTRAGTEASEAPSLASLADMWTDPATAAPQPEVIWDGSVASISDGILKIQDEETRQKLQNEFDELMGLAQIPPHQTALLHTSMYHTLYDLSAAVGEIFDNVTEKSTRPTAERLMQNFYANYLREKAEQEEQERLEAESARETGSLKEKKDLAAMLAELEKETYVSSPAENQEMLTYCLKWIQIMTELRCAMPHGFNYYDEKVAQEQAAVMERMDQKIAETTAQDETTCWNIFSLERQKLELIKEERKLPRMKS